MTFNELDIIKGKFGIRIENLILLKKIKVGWNLII